VVLRERRGIGRDGESMAWRWLVEPGTVGSLRISHGVEGKEEVIQVALRNEGES